MSFLDGPPLFFLWLRVVLDVVILRGLKVPSSAAAARRRRVRVAGQVAAGLGLCDLRLGLVQRPAGGRGRVGARLTPGTTNE